MNLRGQLKMLEDVLVPKEVLDRAERSVSLDPETQVRVNAFLVLSHAVIEEFLEDAILARYDDLVGRADDDEVPSAVAHLAIWAGKRSESATESERNQTNIAYKSFALSRQLSRWRPSVERAIRQNHGIKSDNIQHLCRLAGVDWRNLEDTFESELESLTTLGSKRGSAGHLSPFTVRATGLQLDDSPRAICDAVRDAQKAADKIATYLATV